MHSQNLINIITDALPNLNKSETKVAQRDSVRSRCGDSVQYCDTG